jgi:hypothetical protein
MMFRSRKDNNKTTNDKCDDCPFDITGVWQGDYGKNGIELIEIGLVDKQFIATKMYIIINL